MTESGTVAIIHAIILRPNREPRKGSILIRDGKIQELLPDQLPSLSRSVRKINAERNFVAPGFIDLHVHGAGGHHFSDRPYRNLYGIIRTLYRFGTTSCLPTLSALSPEEILEYIRFIKGPASKSKYRSSILGLNLEGPFISIGKRGAQPLRYIRKADPDCLRQFLKEADGLIKIMTLAPELPGGEDLISLLTASGVIAAIGHTQAGYDETRKAVERGLNYATHIFNSYPPLHHREPGALAAILEEELVNAELIADGVHVSPVLIRLLFRLKAFERIHLVTDGTAAMGKKLAKFTMGGRDVSVADGRASLNDGTLVGSVLPMNQALKNLVEYTSVPLSRAISLATLHPARVLGIDHVKGDLGEGMDADLVIFDRKFTVKRTMVGGKEVFPHPPGSGK
ncbi:MAG TPA: N-acetylglucosamine-6-phosphate deacetylase [bacterium]|nr:N-acetylglucosamine-6-phosphate deacetylase [bacterium]HPQ65107.1 N-acetylglucosamine-6-phosphate deacetylase [bacterium]